jgi:hypothetical protein
MKYGCCRRASAQLFAMIIPLFGTLFGLKCSGRKIVSSCDANFERLIKPRGNVKLKLAPMGISLATRHKNRRNQFDRRTSSPRRLRMNAPQRPLGSGFGPSSAALGVLAGPDLSGMTAIVTSGYSGLGREAVRVFTEAEARVVAPARNQFS